MNDYKLLFQVTGQSTLVQDERITKLAAGDLGLIDVTLPTSFVPHGETGRWIGVHLPRQPLIAQLGFEPHGGLCWRSDALPVRLLRHFLAETVEEAEAALDSSEVYVQLAVYNLIGALFGSSDLSSHFSPRDKLFVRVCGIIKRHFSDPNVGSVEVAGEAGISVRYLQKLFAMRGTTFSHFIKALRLDHAAQLLDRQRTTGLPLSEVAHACGYRDYSHFTRDFRARFGHTPGAFRGRAAL